MIKTPYDTTVCRHYHLEPVVSLLRVAKIEGETISAQSSSKKKFKGVETVHPYAKSIPPFTQPLLLDGVWFIDARAFLTVDRAEGIVRATAPGELDFLILRAVLSKAWNEGEVQSMSYFQDLPARIYARMMSEAIVRRLGLDPMEQMRLSVLSAAFYLTRFMTEASGEVNQIGLATRVARTTSVPADKVLIILESVGELPDNIEGFCEKAKMISANARIQQLNAALIVTSLSGMWYGANSRETVAAAIEYPPFFNALVATSLSERSYKNAPFAKLVQQSDKNGQGAVFLRHVNELLSSYEG